VLVLFTDGISEAEGAEAAVAVDTAGAPVASGNAGSRWPPGEGQAARESAAAAPGEIGGESAERASPMFGEERLIEVIQASAQHSAIEIKDAILAAVADFTAGVAQSDDLTLVIIKRQQASSG
jgi:hypothetical protein